MRWSSKCFNSWLCSCVCSSYCCCCGCSPNICFLFCCFLFWLFVFVWLKMKKKKKKNKTLFPCNFRGFPLFFLSQIRFLQNPSFIFSLSIVLCESLFKQFFGLAQWCFLLLFFIFDVCFVLFWLYLLLF